MPLTLRTLQGTIGDKSSGDGAMDEGGLVAVQLPDGSIVDVHAVYMRPHPISGDKTLVLDTRLSE